MSRLRGLLSRKVLISNIGLVLILIIGMSYLVVNVMRINPLRGTYEVTVNMDRSGGLLKNNDVNYRGYRVGKVTAVNLTDTGLEAKAEINKSAKIPVGGKVAIQALSAAGEQYIDFQPDTNQGPYLEDGSVIDSRDVTTPTPISQVLDNASALIGQIDPKKLNVVIDELDKALGGGPDSLRSVISGLSVLTAGMDAVLPQTTSLVSNLQIIAGTTSQIQPDLGTLTSNSGVLFDQLKNADQELRTFLDLAPGQLAGVGGVIGETSDPMTNLVTNFVSISRAAQLRTPALAILFPELSAGIGALGIPLHDGYFNTSIDIWPRPQCQYDTIPVSPTLVGGQARLYNYCVTNRPELQVRGSANAPRPPGDTDYNAPPPGADPNALSTPLPGR